MARRTPATPCRPGVFALALVSVVSGGCSFLFVNGPPPNHRTSSFFGCTSSNALPFVDVAFAAGSILEAFDPGAGSSGYATASGAQAANVVAYGATAALLAASAAYGFSKTSRCREAQAELLARLPPPIASGRTPPVPYDPWVAHPSPMPSGAPPAPPSPWEAPRPAR